MPFNLSNFMAIGWYILLKLVSCCREAAARPALGPLGEEKEEDDLEKENSAEQDGAYPHVPQLV